MYTRGPLARLSVAALVLLSTVAGAQIARAQGRDFPFLGVFTEPIDAARADSGLVVTYVYPKSSGAAMGLLKGDQIIALNDKIIPNREVFVAELRRENIGAKVRFLVRRDGLKVKVTGKLRSYQKTMLEIQQLVRSRMVGKPLPKLPDALWWNGTKKAFEPRKDPLGGLKGKVGVVFAYDDCPTCTKQRYQWLTNLHLVLRQSRPDAPLTFVGLYESDAQLTEDPKKYVERAAAFYKADKVKPSFPVGVAHFPKGPPTPQEREKFLWIHNHGLVVLDPDGKVAYVQTTGVPQQKAFLTAVQGLLMKHFPDATRSGKTPTPKSPEKKPPVKKPAGTPPAGGK